MGFQATVYFMDVCERIPALSDNPLFGSNFVLHKMEEGYFFPLGQCGARNVFQPFELDSKLQFSTGTFAERFKKVKIA